MFKKSLIELGIRHPRMVMIGSVISTLVFLLSFPSLTVDTDPEHMLPHDNPAITLYKQVKAEFDINDMVVLGINSKDGSSLFTPETLEIIDKVIKDILIIKDESPPETGYSNFIKKLQFLKDNKPTEQSLEIFDKTDIFSISTLDDIILNSSGELLLRPLMPSPPKTQAEADALLQTIEHNPLFHGRLAAEDGSLIGIYIPLNPGKKDRSYYLSQQIHTIAKKYLGPNEEYYIAGLPVAETTFGNEMFIQMGIYAPAAGLVVFLLLFFFFRNIKMITAPMLLSIIVVTCSMGALIIAGQPIHIMSSMIPIFLMPIAVLDSVHIISTLHDSMHKFDSKEAALRHVMHDLFNPMLFTSVTTMVGFSSLGTTGIPPVVVFGFTVAFGVGLAWLLSMVFIPAYVMLLSDETVQQFKGIKEGKKSIVMEVVPMLKGIANNAPRLVIIAAVITLGIALYGVQKIIINDNPVRWFKQSHDIRQADDLMNLKTAGTYLSNLYFSLPSSNAAFEEEDQSQTSNLIEDEFAEDEFADSDDDLSSAISIRNPEVIEYMHEVSNFLLNLKDGTGNKLVGDVTSIIDILQRIGTVAFDDNSLPETRQKVSQYIFLYESGDSKKGRDMWKFISNGDGNSAQIWLQFKTGDNQNLNLVINALDQFMNENPPPIFEDMDGTPIQLSVQWSGLTYINKVWQDQMVSGMAYALASSFIIVFIMMSLLFRSLRWGLVAMLPLTLTIVMIYGVIGYAGKFYDMPMAVLSSLTLGLSIDFAIHFIQSLRQINHEVKDTDKSLSLVFEETGRAIWRNVLVISIGFSPLFFASLVPYVTVGMFFFGIMIVSGITTLILLPAIVKLFYKQLPGF